MSHFKDHIPAAFPGGDSLILDAEVLLVDTNTGNPLPFGTLGVHKVPLNDSPHGQSLLARCALWDLNALDVVVQL